MSAPLKHACKKSSMQQYLLAHSFSIDIVLNISFQDFKYVILLCSGIHHFWKVITNILICMYLYFSFGCIYIQQFDWDVPRCCFPCIYPAWGSLTFLRLKVDLNQIGKFLAITSLNIFYPLVYPLLFMLDSLTLVHWPLRLCSFFCTLH